MLSGNQNSQTTNEISKTFIFLKNLIANNQDDYNNDLTELLNNFLEIIHENNKYYVLFKNDNFNEFVEDYSKKIKIMDPELSTGIESTAYNTARRTKDLVFKVEIEDVLYSIHKNIGLG